MASRYPERRRLDGCVCSIRSGGSLSALSVLRCTGSIEEQLRADSRARTIAMDT